MKQELIVQSSVTSTHRDTDARERHAYGRELDHTIQSQEFGVGRLL